jgi:hypothetical protein
MASTDLLLDQFLQLLFTPGPDESVPPIEIVRRRVALFMKENPNADPMRAIKQLIQEALQEWKFPCPTPPPPPCVITVDDSSSSFWMWMFLFLLLAVVAAGLYWGLNRQLETTTPGEK